MPSSTTSRPAPASPASASHTSPMSFRHRRDSINSLSTSSVVGREQLASALDQIHSSASQTDALTTFNDFAPSPKASPGPEGKGNAASEMVQNGLSGLYTRFREAVGVTSPNKAAPKEDDTTSDVANKRTSTAGSHVSRPSASSLHRIDTIMPSSPTSSQPTPKSELSSSGVLTVFPSASETRPPSQPTKQTTKTSASGTKSSSSSRPSLTARTKSSATLDPTIAPVTAHRDPSRSTTRTDTSAGQDSGRKSISKGDLQSHLSPSDPADGRNTRRSRRDDASSYDGSVDAAPSPTKGLAPSPMPPLTRNHARSPSESSSVLLTDGNRRTPAVIDRISHPRSPVYPRSRESSMDRGATETSHINTSAHGSVYHDSFSQDNITLQKPVPDPRMSRTAATLEGASEQMNAQLERMRRQVLSKEIWMKDDTVKECFACQTPFSAFRRKHHCRTCGCIFDSKCTTVVSGERFGVQGNLRVCKRCLEAINRRYDDGSGSEDSGDDEQSFLPRIFGGGQKSSDQHAHPFPRDHDMGAISEGSEDSRPLSTPMMAIPATRRVNESNRNSAILEIDAGPQLSRPGSSRSLKSLATARPQSSAGHKRHHSKHGFLGRFKPQQEDRAPFRKGVDEDDPKKPKFPAFHDDNIIDPELADFMSDDSSGDEQMSIFATMGTADLQSATFENEKTSLSPFVNASRKHKHRAGEKSLSGISYLSREDTTGPPSAISHRRNNRRRNLSNVSGSVYHVGSPRPKSAIYKGPSASTDMLQAMEHQFASGAHLTRSDSLQKRSVTKTKLNNSSVRHVDKLLHQLLIDAMIPNAAAWQKALVPILLQCTDDVSPDVANGEDMDIRHYVKLKRIPGGKPGDTIYTSGVVFTKNLALKSMPRRISNPRIVLVTFPIEYQRHQQHFMSLQPVIEQEKEFLRVVVQRITNLRPHVLLAEKGVSGVALQYLSEANISVAYNVKHTVIEAVARCAETEIISSLDRLALPVRVGRCSGFNVRTFVNNDHPGRKKSYIFFSGCRPDLGCTIALRGANSGLLAKVKYIMEFMVYVVYNLKLESSLLQDESIEPPEGDNSSLNSGGAANDSFRSLNNSVGSIEGPRIGPQMFVQQPSGEGESAFEIGTGGGMTKMEAQDGTISERPKLVSLHESHGRASQDGHVPDDVPMPTFYSDMVAKYETKILSASPYVKFTQPYLLMKAREQERRLLYLRRLRDQDVIEEQGDPEKQEPAKFQLIKPELVEELGQKAPRQIMEILHAVHDAEYDKALFNYQTQTRQWETYIQGNLDLFDPFSHQNIVVLYSEICTDTKIPCTEPSLVAINFYDEQHVYTGMDPDCTLGQYIQDLAESKDRTCESSGCERKLVEHHRTYVHDQSRVTIFVEHAPSGATSRPDLGERITMWTYCKICKKDSEESAMSDATFKYSFGKYLELLYWGRGLRMKSNLNCPHDHHMDHVRYFSLDDARIRIHLDPIDLLEIVVPRTRITWKVVNDLKLKNEIFSKVENRWKKFMDSVIARLGGIRIDSVLPEKAEKCQAEVDLMKQKAQEEKPALVQKLQDVYVNSKYYEVVPFNTLVREMVERAGEWDEAFNKFERDFLNDTDMRQLTIQQLRKMFTDDESKEGLVTTEGTASTADSEERTSQTFTEAEERPTQPTEYTENDMDSSAYSKATDGSKQFLEDGEKVHIPAGGAIERVEPLDLAGSPTAIVHAGQLEHGSSEPISEVSSSDTPIPSRPDVSPTGPDRSATEPSHAGQSLTDKIHQMRREFSRHSPQASESSSPEETRQTSVQSSSRVSESSSSPPLVRATSHPSRALTRTQSSIGKQTPSKDSKISQQDTTAVPRDGSIKVDKKFSDRLGLTALKNRSKGATSNIPRLVKKNKESKVSTLARHFEQLSKEFEKERIRKRASSMRHHHTMLPRASTKATVHVYEDVQEAFAEAPPQNDPEQERKPEPKGKAVPATEASKSEQSTEPPTPAEPVSRIGESQQSQDADNTTSVTASQAGSDDEEGDSEHGVSAKYLPEIEDLAEKLEPTDIPLELPKDQKTSLMKYLTTFWAERSASGWPALEYPVNPTDHIFVDSDIIVREDEPSSVIALALNSDDYQDKLGHIRREAQEIILREGDGGGNESDTKSVLRSDVSEALFEETDLEKSLLRVTGTHLKYQFKEGAAVMTCKIFYAEQFDALRRKCGVAERIVESLSRCLKWDSKGGKTKSVFLKTLDDRLILKSLSPVETSAFLRFAPGYFNIMAEALFHDLPSVIAKMLGFFQVIIKNPVTGTDIKLDLLITENLFYDRSPSRIFDLKGSMRNRKIESTGEQNEVLLDENMVEYIYESPLFAREHSKKLLRASVWNDTLFLARQNVMDYSLMIAVDEPRKELVVGIIDCIRTYTWDKKLESWIKDRGFAGGGRNRPTVTSPKEYKSRFREAMAR